MQESSSSRLGFRVSYRANNTHDTANEIYMLHFSNIVPLSSLPHDTPSDSKIIQREDEKTLFTIAGHPLVITRTHFCVRKSISPPFQRWFPHITVVNRGGREREIRPYPRCTRNSMQANVNSTAQLYPILDLSLFSYCFMTDT